MRLLLLVGIVLMGAGAYVLLTGASFASTEEVLRVGDVKLTAEHRHTLPPWSGAVALIAGIACIVSNARHRA